MLFNTNYICYLVLFHLNGHVECHEYYIFIKESNVMCNWIFKYLPIGYVKKCLFTFIFKWNKHIFIFKATSFNFLWIDGFVIFL